LFTHTYGDSSYCFSSFDDIYRIDWSDYNLMPRHNEYFVVEFRFPVTVESVKSVQEAMSFAGQVFQNQFGFKPDNWNARIFQYSTDSNSPGHVKEFFYNPNSSTYREITKNLAYHNDLVQKGELPEGVSNEN
jgi:hypothetical protein